MSNHVYIVLSVLLPKCMYVRTRTRIRRGKKVPLEIEVIHYTYTYIVCMFSLCMYKKHTTLNIDNELLEEAKKNSYNVSEIAEKALRERLGKKEVEINETVNACEFCGRELDKAKASNPNEGLTWLYPDEKWICPKCLRRKSRII